MERISLKIVFELFFSKCPFLCFQTFYCLSCRKGLSGCYETQTDGQHLDAAPVHNTTERRSSTWSDVEPHNMIWSLPRNRAFHTNWLGVIVKTGPRALVVTSCGGFFTTCPKVFLTTMLNSLNGVVILWFRLETHDDGDTRFCTFV